MAAIALVAEDNFCASSTKCDRSGLTNADALRVTKATLMLRSQHVVTQANIALLSAADNDDLSYVD
ncbi:MAG: hypothetical protein V7K69_22155 [Nostoc sp.]|uniref:hypothetical protein n=1 Tax=Nostoc sp. TaxID=1180 RepID=UPI002FF96BEF